MAQTQALFYNPAWLPPYYIYYFSNVFPLAESRLPTPGLDDFHEDGWLSTSTNYNQTPGGPVHFYAGALMIGDPSPLPITLPSDTATWDLDDGARRSPASGGTGAAV